MEAKDDDYNPYLYVPSNWQLSEKLVPYKLKDCMNTFALALWKLFKKDPLVPFCCPELHQQL